MLEMPPFWNCPSCNTAKSFGVLNVYGAYYTRRCASCRYEIDIPLPEVDKKVIYLDQFVISNMLSHAADPRKESHHKEFWVALHDQIKRLLLLQAVIFPNSDIHLDESLVARNFGDLRDMYRSINGDVSFIDTDDIEQRRIIEFAKSWVSQQGVPEDNWTVDDILRGNRNQWTPVMSVNVNSDYSRFAEGTRDSRDAKSEEFSALFETWMASKPSFEDVLKMELSSIGRVYWRQLIDFCTKIAKGEDLSLEDLLSVSNRRTRILSDIFEASGIDKEKTINSIHEFYEWDGLEHIPAHRFGAYIFAAIARRASNGQKNAPNKGVFNDISMVSNYLPFVDAIFIDKECASLISEPPLPIDIGYNTDKIFSLRNKEQFLEYLTAIEEAVSEEIRIDSKNVYG